MQIALDVGVGLTKEDDVAVDFDTAGGRGGTAAAEKGDNDQA